ncbi:MAG TPA: hypothetical protein VNO17_06980 [Actinomycetota bacterium]|nr:hypothetical protein [Actinomycetota bacterium]
MSPLDVSRAMPVASVVEFDRWLRVHGGREREVVLAIYNKASGKQTVSLVALQEAALRHGWVDAQTKRLDQERYAIRFTPRRPGSTWSAKNRRMARRLLNGGRMTAAGIAALPPDL